MDTVIHFGTDGWRGRIADDYTFSNVRRCAQGFANYLLSKYRLGDQKRLSIVIGYDTRFMSEYFAQTAAEVLCGNGFHIFLADKATPTPVLSFHVPLKKAIGCVNITASHNPGSDNGFKVRDQHGGSIPQEDLNMIETVIPEMDDFLSVKSIGLKTGLNQGLIEYFDPKPEYMKQINNLIDVQPIKDAGLKVVVDNMWGNSIGWLSEIIGGGSTEVIEIHSLRNPLFPEMDRPEPIPPNVDVGLDIAKKLGANCVCIFDGDADRCGFGDENGQFVDQLRVFALLAYYLLEIRGKRGTIVKTLSTTSMLDKLGSIYGVPVVATPVGFKYVAPAMLQQANPLIGGEESGGYAFQGHVPERDGILANLFLLDFMVKTGKTPTQLLDQLFNLVGPHYYKRVDIVLGDSETKEHARMHLMESLDNMNELSLGGHQVVEIVTRDGFKYVMDDGGWLLIRFSDTEPKLRVYTETMDSKAVSVIIEDGVKLAGI